MISPIDSYMGSYERRAFNETVGFFKEQMDNNVDGFDTLREEVKPKKQGLQDYIRELEQKPEYQDTQREYIGKPERKSRWRRVIDSVFT